MPQDLYRAVISELDVHCTKAYGKAFHLLPDAEQDTFLAALESDDLDLASAPASLLFGLLLRNTMEGFFADPIHGGNRDKAGGV